MIVALSEVDRLRARVAELESEVEEWRRQDKEGASLAIDLTRVHIVHRHLGAPPGEARLLVALLDMAPKAVRHGELDRVVREGELGEADPDALVKTRVCLLRGRLRRRLPTVTIETVYGKGYRISAHAAAVLNAWFDAHV